MEGIYTLAAPSSSITYGNISCAVRELLFSFFPPNMFKYVHISSELAFRNTKRIFGSNSSLEFKKREKPFMIITPSYTDMDDDNRFLYGTPLTTTWDSVHSGVDKRYLFDIINDRDNGFKLRYKMSRDLVNYEVRLVFETLHQQLDIYRALDNLNTWDRPYIYRASLESLIPRTIVMQIAHLLHIDIDEKNNDNIAKLLQYFRRASRYPITYKMKNASGRDEFFLYYDHNTIVNLTGLRIDGGNKKNMVDDAYEITFNVGIEFNLPALYMLSGNPDIIQKLRVDLVHKDYYTNDKEIIPILTVNNFYNQYPTYRDGFKFYITSMFNVELTKNNHDILPINELFSNDLIHIINENVMFNVDMSTLFKIILIKGNVELVEGKDYTINWNKLEVDISNLDPSETYRIVIYMNSIHINERLQEITDDKNTEKDHV